MSEAKLAKQAKLAYSEIRREVLGRIQDPEKRARAEKIIEDLYGFLKRTQGVREA